MGPGRLRVVCGLSTLAVCGGSAALVLQDPHPQAAPLVPPVTGTEAASHLVIPPSCSQVKIATGAGGGAPAVKLSPAAQKALQDIAAAGGDKAKVRAILAGLSAKDRLAVAAAQRMQAAGGTSAPCSPGAGGSGGGSIDPSVGGDGPNEAVAVSNVS
jgi:hypothetical protein